MKSRITKAPLQHVRPKREGMDAGHLANVRKCDCLGCGRVAYAGPSIQAHHLLRAGPGERGMSITTKDRWAVPLCFLCHDPRQQGSVHHNGDEDRWFAVRGIDARAVARALWAARGDLGGMRRVIFRAHQAAALTVRTNA